MGERRVAKVKNADRVSSSDRGTKVDQTAPLIRFVRGIQSQVHVRYLLII